MQSKTVSTCCQQSKASPGKLHVVLTFNDQHASWDMGLWLHVTVAGALTKLERPVDG